MYTSLLLLFLLNRHYLYYISCYCIWVSHNFVWCSTCINVTVVRQSSTGCTITESYNAHFDVKLLCNALWTVQLSSTYGQLRFSLVRQATVQKVKEGDNFGRSKRSFEDNIETDLKKICWEGVDWVHVAQDKDRWRVGMNTVITFWVLRGAFKF